MLKTPKKSFIISSPGPWLCIILEQSLLFIIFCTAKERDFGGFIWKEEKCILCFVVIVYFVFLLLFPLHNSFHVSVNSSYLYFLQCNNILLHSYILFVYRCQIVRYPFCFWFFLPKRAAYHYFVFTYKIFIFYRWFPCYICLGGMNN